MIKIDNDKVILVVPNNIKKRVLNEISLSNRIQDIKIMSLEEIRDKYYFTYDDRSYQFIHDKYHYQYDIIKIILDNLYYVSDNSNSYNMNLLRDIKKSLISNNLLIFDEGFIEYLKNREIVVYGYSYINKFMMRMLNDLKSLTEVKIIDEELLMYQNNDVYEFNSIEDEVHYVINKIASLLDSGIKIDKIKIVNLNEDYLPVINRISKLYGIEIAYDNEIILGNTLIGKYVINNYPNLAKIEEAFDFNNALNTKIYNQIINIINNININDLEYLSYILNNTSIKKNSGIECTSLLDNQFSDDDYIFLVNFNDGSIPSIYVDEDFLIDKDKSLCGIDTSYDFNKIIYQKTIDKIKSIKNIYITYKLYSNSGEYLKSNLVNDMNLEIKHINIYDNNISYSKQYDKLELARMLDQYTKYNVIDKNLDKLYSNNTEIKYRTYDNTFKGIDKIKLYTYLNKSLTLSYSSLNNFYLCQFKFYLDNILKIGKHDKTIDTTIGNLYHYVLEKYYKDKIDPTISINRFIKDNDLNRHELFIIENIRDEIIFVVNDIEMKRKYISLNNFLLENRIEIDKSKKDFNVKFKGFVDKIMYEKINDITYVSVIDYKTGDVSFDINKIIYGLDLQLPTYLYLIKFSNLFSNLRFCGFYLQKILYPKFNYDSSKTNDQLKHDYLKLNGYSNSDIDTLKLMDSNYVDSNIIKSLKMTSNGFSTYAKLINDENIDRIIDVVDQRINDLIDKVTEAEFIINPKRIDKNNISCTYCKYKDICYHTENDIKDLELEEFL